MKNSLILIPFNAFLTDVCDYAKQTVEIVRRDNQVLGIALSNPVSPYKDPLTVLTGRFFVKHWGVPVLRPLMIVPFQRFDMVRRLNITLTILVLNLWFLFRNQRVVLWFFEPRYVRIFLHWLKKDFSLFDCVDYFTAYEDWREEQLFCLQNADMVAVNSRTLFEKYRPVRRDLIQVPLGFSSHDIPSLSTFRKRSRSGSLTLGFVGAVGDRLDFEFLKDLMRSRPEDKLVFIGPQTFTNTPLGKKKRQQFQTLVKERRVQWSGPFTRKQTWRKAQQFDAGIIPYEASSLFDRFSFPMKIMEYFYMGLPVIASEIKELSRYPKFVYMPQQKGWKGVGAFLKQWRREYSRKQRATALQHTWQKKIDALYQEAAARMERRSRHT
jgi:glycosyltransferase involved in cell wall biosynthesis